MPKNPVYFAVSIVRKVNWHCFCTIAVLALMSSLQANAQITGLWRADFIKGSAIVSFKTQRAGPINKDISDKHLQQYCVCTMTYIAELLNNQLATDIENGFKKMNPVWNQMAAQYCQKNFSKY